LRHILNDLWKVEHDQCDAGMSQTSEHMIQGILVSGVAYYMQVWVIEKSGPIFLAMTMPITLLVTIILSLFLGEAITLGRCVFVFSLFTLLFL
jgi:drug/metabolite transporter (DMT)-like permease